MLSIKKSFCIFLIFSHIFFNLSIYLHLLILNYEAISIYLQWSYNWCMNLSSHITPHNLSLYGSRAILRELIFWLIYIHLFETNRMLNNFTCYFPPKVMKFNLKIYLENTYILHISYHNFHTLAHNQLYRMYLYILWWNGLSKWQYPYPYDRLI